MESPLDPGTFPKRGRDDLGIFCLPQQVTRSCCGKLSVSSRCALCLATGSWITASSAVPGGCHFLGSRAFCTGCWSAERAEFLTRAEPHSCHFWHCLQRHSPSKKAVHKTSWVITLQLFPYLLCLRFFLLSTASWITARLAVPGGCQDPERGVQDAGAQRALNSWQGQFGRVV